MSNFIKIIFIIAILIFEFFLFQFSIQIGAVSLVLIFATFSIGFVINKITTIVEQPSLVNSSEPFRDSPKYADVFDGDSANFNVDLTLPDFQFNVIRNDIFWEYYDLYITNSESILNTISGENYNPLLLIQYQNGTIDTITTTSSEHGPIHYTSHFQSEDSITFIKNCNCYIC